eukprot:766979-Hanusia_phi.AAC.6
MEMGIRTARKVTRAASCPDAGPSQTEQGCTMAACSRHNSSAEVDSHVNGRGLGRNQRNGYESWGGSMGVGGHNRHGETKRRGEDCGGQHQKKSTRRRIQDKKQIRGQQNKRGKGRGEAWRVI